MYTNVSAISAQLSSIYLSNNSQIASAMSRIASGNRFQKPSDDFVSYIRSENIQRSIDNYGIVKQDLTDAKTVVGMAEGAGQNIYENLTRMKELKSLYTGTSDTDLRATYAAEFNTLKSAVSDTISNTKYNGMSVVGTSELKSVYTNPEHTTELTVQFGAGDIVSTATISGWDISTVSEANIQDQMKIGADYLAKARGFTKNIDRNLNVTETIMESKASTKNLISGIDEATELSNLTQLQVRQNATIAMFSQANMNMDFISKLFGGN